MKCRKCGCENSDSNKFCNQCGEVLVDSPKPIQDYVFCTHCGAKIRNGVNFCKECGSVVKAANNIKTEEMVAQPVSHQVTATGVLEQQEPIQQELIQQEHPQQASIGQELEQNVIDSQNIPMNDSPVKKQGTNTPSAKNKAGVVLVVLLSIIIVVGIVLMVIMFRQNKKSGDTGETQLIATTEVATEATTEEITTEVTTTEEVTTEAITTEATVEDTEEFIFADSDIRYLTRDELEPLSKEDLAIARNEIYARHGYIFTMEEYDTYFRSLSWYTPEIGIDEWSEDMLSEIEKENRSLILDYEKEMGYVQ